MAKNYHMKCNTGYLGAKGIDIDINKPKFIHYFTPKIDIKRFDLVIPAFKALLKIRNAVILDEKTELYRTRVLSLKGRIKFKVPIKLEIGKKYSLVIS